MIYQCDNWLTNDEINYILNINFEFVPGRVSSKVNDNVSVKVKPIRQCLVHRIEYGNNLYFDLLTQKMADFFNVKNIGCIEPLSIVKYNTGDYFNPHNDSWGYGGERKRENGRESDSERRIERTMERTIERNIERER